MAVVCEGLRNAAKMFEDLESDLDSSGDESLIEHFHLLRDNAAFGIQMLAHRGQTTAPLPPSTQGPDPDDVRSHLTRKTPIPEHPIPFLGKLAEIGMDPDKAPQSGLVSVQMPPPPPEVSNEHDFFIDVEKYQAKSKCTKVAGMAAPGKLHTFQKRMMRADPLDPTKGNPKASRDSPGAISFRKRDITSSTSESEFVQYAVSSMAPPEPERIAQETLDKEADTGRITQEEINEDDDEEADTGRITQEESSAVKDVPVLPSDPDFDDSITIKAKFEENAVSAVVEFIAESDKEFNTKLTKAVKPMKPVGKIVQIIEPRVRRSPIVKLHRLDDLEGFPSELESREKRLVSEIARNVVQTVAGPSMSKQKETQGNKNKGASSSGPSSERQIPARKSVQIEKKPGWKPFSQPSGKVFGKPGRLSRRKKCYCPPPAPAPAHHGEVIKIPDDDDEEEIVMLVPVQHAKATPEEQRETDVSQRIAQERTEEVVELDDEDEEVERTGEGNEEGEKEKNEAAAIIQTSEQAKDQKRTAQVEEREEKSGKRTTEVEAQENVPATSKGADKPVERGDTREGRPKRITQSGQSTGVDTAKKARRENKSPKAAQKKQGKYKDDEDDDDDDEILIVEDPDPPSKMKVKLPLPRHKKQKKTDQATGSANPSTAHPPSRQKSARPVPSTSHQPPAKRGTLSCNKCDFTTNRAETLNLHMNKHSGIKFTCSQCPKTYFSMKSMNNHIKLVHEGVERCSCTVPGCKWTGTDYGVKKVHMYEVHGQGEAPVCHHPDCKDRGHFSNFRTLERHRETHHNKDKRGKNITFI